MSKLYHNPPRAYDRAAAPLLQPRIKSPRLTRHRDPIAYGRMRGKDLAALREYHGLSMTKFATILNCSRNAVRNWERGDRPIPLEMYPVILLFAAAKDGHGNPLIAPGLALVDLKTNEILRLF